MKKIIISITILLTIGFNSIAKELESIDSPIFSVKTFICKWEYRNGERFSYEDKLSSMYSVDEWEKHSRYDNSDKRYIEHIVDSINLQNNTARIIGVNSNSSGDLTVDRSYVGLFFIHKTLTSIKTIIIYSTQDLQITKKFPAIYNSSTKFSKKSIANKHYYGICRALNTYE